MAYIEVSNVTKEFKITKPQKGAVNILRSFFHREYTIKKAVDDISFEINQGELVGYIGPNGAGKSTTIKMMSGILTPSAGKITVGGIVPYANRKENNLRMGVVFGQRSQLYWDLPMSETFALYKKMYRIDEKRFQRNVDFYVEMLDMQSFLDTPVRQLSLGQKMRGNIAVSLLHDPEVLYLDEPTIGLDVVAKNSIRKFIKEVNREKNTTLVLTTHDMGDIEAICSRLIMIDNGRKLYDGSLKDFKEIYTGGSVLIADFNTELPVDLEDPRLRIQKEDGSRKWISFKKSEISPMEVLETIHRKYQISDFSLKEAAIEETVQEIYEKSNLL